VIETTAAAAASNVTILENDSRMDGMYTIERGVQ
jgi:hypothetical protein